MGKIQGQAFENILDHTNKVYQRKGVALINKRSTPVTVTRMNRGRITNGFFAAKSTVDYDGIYNGQAIVFEAKSTKGASLPLSDIADHQIDYLNKAEKQGAIAFLIIELRRLDEVYVLPNEILQEYVNNAKNGGRKSIPIDDIADRGIEVKTRNGIPLDYLNLVEELKANDE